MGGFQTSELSIVAGSNLLDEGGSTHEILEVIIHEDYTVGQMWKNDLCVIKVNPPFALENGTAAVILETNAQDPPNNSNATLVGWGSLSIQSQISNDLRKAALPIVERTACQKDYGIDAEIYESQICAGGNGDKDACRGDGGGPLFVDQKQVGILSWGRPCAYAGFPSVYTKVSHYIDWIKHHTQ
ncbi:trypsin-1-like [Hetaerina americana]|uniref:trypsin-1-like n=1 Tax=Hetaerina americana TaxID=62018 RepID=UPI003A7F5296